MSDAHARNRGLSDQPNESELDAARRDIVWMYVDLIRSYRGFGHGIDTGGFDPRRILALTCAPATGDHEDGTDRMLLKTGAAIALLCDISDAFDECDTWDTGSARIEYAKQLSEQGGFADLPEIAQAFRHAFAMQEDAFRRALQRVFELHVLGYFRHLIDLPPQ